MSYLNTNTIAYVQKVYCCIFFISVWIIVILSTNLNWISIFLILNIASYHIALQRFILIN